MRSYIKISYFVLIQQITWAIQRSDWLKVFCWNCWFHLDMVINMAVIGNSCFWLAEIYNSLLKLQIQMLLITWWYIMWGHLKNSSFYLGPAKYMTAIWLAINFFSDGLKLKKSIYKIYRSKWLLHRCNEIHDADRLFLSQKLILVKTQIVQWIQWFQFRWTSSYYYIHIEEYLYKCFYYW